jgi:SAM-dependent methyltransferase
VASEIPAYFDFLIDGFRRGWTGRHVHLGYWDDPPSLSTPLAPGEFERAQQRLTNLAVGAGELGEGCEALDVGCGFGSLLEALARTPRMRLTGVGNDPRQLAICGSIARGDATLALVEADACALPFPSERFDRVFCIEAIFHFSSRANFLAEAARVLKPGGKLVMTDILLARPGPGAPIGEAAIEAAIRAGYGPWPALWTSAADLADFSRAAGLELETMRDISRETLPSCRMTAPRPWDGSPARADAGSLLRWLHESGRLTYALMRLCKCVCGS